MRKTQGLYWAGVVLLTVVLVVGLVLRWPIASLGLVFFVIAALLMGIWALERARVRRRRA